MDSMVTQISHPEDSPSAPEMTKKIHEARQVFLWKQFGTIGFDAYLAWVRKEGSPTPVEEEAP